MIDLTPRERAALDLASQADLYTFSRWMFLQTVGFPWLRAPHHQLICDALMRVFGGECLRLIINIPPRYSKTQLAVIYFIAWCFGQAPDCEFIHCSYSAELAANNSGKIRSLVQHEAYRRIFPSVELAGTAQAHWKTTKDGVMYAAGTGGSITGFGAGKMRQGFGGCILADDLHKADEARSDTMRRNVIDWWQNTLESRKNSPHTPMVLIMQRLHEDDIAGWLLNGNNGEKWEHLCLPALREDGTALWPEKHTAEVLRVMERASPYTFAGQYQQRPAPPEGLLFRPDMMPVVEAIPAGARFVRGWDLAGSTDTDSPYTAGAKLGETPDGRYVIADMARDQGRPEEVEAMIKNTAGRDGRECAIDLPQDPGQAGKSQAQNFVKMLAGFNVSTSPESGDKVTRAEPFAAQVNVGNVMMLRAPWNDALIAELRLFPNSKFKDQVDALSRAFAHFVGGNTNALDFMRLMAEKAAAAKP